MKLQNILAKAKNGYRLRDQEIQYLLEQKNEANIELIFETARDLRCDHFGTKVFLYGFVYYSTFCKNDCNFCFYRKSNSKPPRYRKDQAEIIQTAIKLKDSGVNLIDLTMGEDPYYIDHQERIVDLAKKVKAATGLPVMVSPGVIDKRTIAQLAQNGIEWFALYQETHNKDLYSQLRSDQDFQERMNAKKYAKARGMLIEEGLLAGAGNQVEDTVYSLNVMRQINASQVRTMTFIPQEGTPLQGNAQNGFLAELLNIAVMRILFPDKLIPASLDVDGLKGLRDRLNAGANVVTSIIPPLDGYAGVANASHDIDDGYRTVDGIQETLKSCHLENATTQEYRQWINAQNSPKEAICL
ncbi:methylornithine synthase PylB [Eubacteriaceae bacterium ES2]|nr:methylornithine synthase PylB [Eubacteriaceae bacterium ES2]